MDEMVGTVEIVDTPVVLTGRAVAALRVAIDYVELAERNADALHIHKGLRHITAVGELSRVEVAEELRAIVREAVERAWAVYTARADHERRRSGGGGHVEGAPSS